MSENTKTQTTAHKRIQALSGAIREAFEVFDSAWSTERDRRRASRGGVRETFYRAGYDEAIRSTARTCARCALPITGSDTVIEYHVETPKQEETEENENIVRFVHEACWWRSEAEYYATRAENFEKALRQLREYSVSNWFIVDEVLPNSNSNSDSPYERDKARNARIRSSRNS